VESTKDSSNIVLFTEKTAEPTVSLLKDHLLPVKNSSALLHVTHYDYIIFSVLLVLFALFVWLYAFNQKLLVKTIQDFFLFRSRSRRLTEGAGIGNRASVFLSLFFVITLSILIGSVLDYYGIVLFESTIPNEFIIGLCTVLMYVIKMVVIKLAGAVFKLQNEATEYMLQIVSYWNVVGLFLFPVIIFLSFFEAAPPAIFIFTGLIMVLSFLGIRSINGILFGLNSSKISKFYLFIYLCALEILPFIIIAKLIILRIK
jgi:hypothetical protein